MPEKAPPDAILRHVSTVLGLELPPESGAGLAANFRLLLSHWAQFGTPEKEPE